MGNTIELEQKDNEGEFLEIRTGLPDCRVIVELNRLGLNKISSKRKGDRIMDRLNISLHNQKYIENKKE